MSIQFYSAGAPAVTVSASQVLATAETLVQTIESNTAFDLNGGTPVVPVLEGDQLTFQPLHENPEGFRRFHEALRTRDWTGQSRVQSYETGFGVRLCGNEFYARGDAMQWVCLEAAETLGIISQSAKKVEDVWQVELSISGGLGLFQRWAGGNDRIEGQLDIFMDLTQFGDLSIEAMFFLASGIYMTAGGVDFKTGCSGNAASDLRREEQRNVATKIHRYSRFMFPELPQNIELQGVNMYQFRAGGNWYLSVEEKKVGELRGSYNPKVPIIELMYRYLVSNVRDVTVPPHFAQLGAIILKNE